MNITQISFDKMMEKELTPLRNYALSLTHNLDETKDLVQETILKAYRYKEKFQRIHSSIITAEIKKEIHFLILQIIHIS